MSNHDRAVISRKSVIFHREKHTVYIICIYVHVINFIIKPKSIFSRGFSPRIFPGSTFSTRIRSLYANEIGHLVQNEILTYKKLPTVKLVEIVLDLPWNMEIWLCRMNIHRFAISLNSMPFCRLKLSELY